LGCHPNQPHRAAFVYAKNKGINHPWDKQATSGEGDCLVLLEDTSENTSCALYILKFYSVKCVQNSDM